MTTREKLIQAKAQRAQGELADARRLELEAMDELLIKAYESIECMACPKCGGDTVDIGCYYSCQACAITFEKENSNPNPQEVKSISNHPCGSWDMWVVYRYGYGGIARTPIAAFSIQGLADEWKQSCPHRSRDAIRRKSVMMYPPSSP